MSEAKSKAAKPGTKDPKAKKEVVKRSNHPLIGNTDTTVYPFPAPTLPKDDNGNIVGWASGAPDDWEQSKHMPFKKADFAEEWQYHQWRVEQMEKKLTNLRAARAEALALGGAKDRAAAKRLGTMAKRIAEIQSKLEAGDVDVGAILKASGVDVSALQALINQANAAPAA